MRRSIIAFLLVLAPGVCFGTASMMGYSGLFSLPAARTFPRGLLAVGVYGEYARDEYPRVFKGHTMDDKHHYVEGRSCLTYGIFDFLETYSRVDMFGKYDEQSDELGERPDPYTGGVAGLEVGFKFGTPLFEASEFGLAFVPGMMASMNFAHFGQPSGDVDTLGTGFKPYIGHNPDVMADLLADLEIKPLTIHMNAGYLVAGEARDGVHERDNETHWGVGAELQAGMYVAILGEVVAEKVVDAEQPALDTVKLTPGLRFMTPKGVNFDVGVEFAMTDFNFVPDTKPKGANWNAVLGVSVNAVMLRSAAEIPKVEVAGRITDRETGEPLDALITVPGSGYRPVYSDPETGAFTLALDQGMVRVMVSKEGYKWQEKTLMLEPPEKVLVDFELSRKEPASGLLTGVVKDPETQTPLPAHVTLIDLTGYVTGSDPGTGIYLLKVPAGTHFLKVTSQDYEPSAVPVVVEPGKTAIQNFDLTPKKTVEETRRAVEEARRVGSGTRESGMGTQAGGGAQRAGGGAQQAGAGMQQAGEEYAGGPASGGAGEQAGQQSCLQGVNFAFDSWALEPSYNSVLMRDLEMLKANPKMIVEIRGHTDYIGPIPPNIDLSLERAISVRDWFVAHGVALERLPIRGYGKSKPIASNATEQGRWLNRRVEIVPIYQ